MGGAVVAAFKFIGAVFGIGSAGTGLYALAVNVARIGVLAFSAKALSPKPDLSAAALEKSLTVRDSIALQTFTYGEDEVSGPILFTNVGGTDNRVLTVAIPFAGHEIDSVLAYRLDDTVINLSDLSGAIDGNVISGKYDGVATVDLLRGTATQSASSLLTTPYPGLFNSAHTGRGWAYMVWTFTLIEGQEEAFNSGAPGNLRCRFRGRRIYDPRQDSLNGGIGSQRVDDPTTWTYSNNPALATVDFLRDDKFGYRETSDRIDWPLVIAAADICDQQVDTPSGLQNRYTCNGTFSSDQPRREVRDELLQSMLGRIVFSQGVWRIWAGAPIASDVTLTEANLAGDLQVQASAGSKERYNRVRGKFVDASRDWVAVAYPEQRSTAFELEDNNEVRELVLDLATTTNEFEAQRKAITVLKQSRNQRVVVFQGNWSCFRIQPGTTVTLDIDELGFASEKFFVTQWAFGPNGVELTMVQEDDSVWADPLVGDYTTRTATGVIEFGETGVIPPSVPTAATFTGGVNINWTNPPANTFDFIEVWRSNDNDRNNAVLIATTQASEYFDALPDLQSRRYYWIRAVDSKGRVSVFAPDLTTTTAVAFPRLQELAVIRDPFIRIGASEWDLNGAVYVPGGGSDGTDAIDIGATGGASIGFRAAERRGPDEFDVQAFNGLALEVRARVRLQVEGLEVWSTTLICQAVVTNEDGSDPEFYTLRGGTGWSFGDTAPSDYRNVTWSGVLDNEASKTVPRYIQISLFQGDNLTAPVVRVDFINAGIIGQVFNPASGKSVGLVPDSQGTGAGTYLDSDGNWTIPAGGGGASQLSDLTDVNTSTPTNRNVLVADGTDFESRALVEADISDLDNYLTPAEGDAAYLGISAQAADSALLGGFAPSAYARQTATNTFNVRQNFTATGDAISLTDDSAIALGNLDDALIRWLGSSNILQLNASGGDIELDGSSSGNIIFQLGNLTEMQVQNSDASDNLTGAEIRHRDQDLYDVGMAQVKAQGTVTSGFTVGIINWHRRIKCSGTFTITFNSASSWPKADSVMWIQNLGSGTITINGIGVTVNKYLAGGRVTGNAQIAPGGWATVAMNATNSIDVTGLNVT